MNRLILVFLFFAWATSILAQKSPVKFGDIPMEDLEMKIYPLDSSADAVVLVDYAESALNYNKEKGFQLVFERIRRVKILKREGFKWANFSVPLYHDSDQEEKITGLKVITYNLEAGKIMETKAKSESFIKEKYDANLNYTKVAWQNVKEGSILELAYKVTSDFLFNFQDWEFQSEIPTKWSEYRARIPEYFNYEKYMQGYIPLSIVENSSSPQSIQFTSTERTNLGFGAQNTTFNNERIDYNESRFRWAAADIPAFKQEAYMTSSREYISKINFELSYTKFPNSAIKHYMGTWQDIATSYWDRVGDEITGNNSLKKVMEEVTVGQTTVEGKVLAIYNYVKQNILWDETNRKYVESNPKKILDDKKGSSAELNLLLACLLEKAEIQVNPVLLSTRDHGFVRESNPVSSQFNYMICAIKIGDKRILLDATDKLLPVGVLPTRCLNGLGLQVSKEGFEWVNLYPSTKSRISYTVDAGLGEEGNLKARLKIDKVGYHSINARKSYLSKGEKEYTKDFVGARSWVISSSEFQNVNEMSQPFKEIYEINVTEHLTEANNTIYFSPFILAKESENPFKQQTRNYPVDFSYPSEVTYVMKFTIPEGYALDDAPKSKVIALPENAAKFLFNVSQVGSIINITSSLSINKSVFTQLEYPNLREFYSQVVAKQAEQIVIKKTK
jgi:hypothetical protein